MIKCRFCSWSTEKFRGRTRNPETAFKLLRGHVMSEHYGANEALERLISQNLEEEG